MYWGELAHSFNQFSKGQSYDQKKSFQATKMRKSYEVLQGIAANLQSQQKGHPKRIVDDAYR